MTEYFKKNKVNIYLLLVIAGLASLPLMSDSVLAEAGVFHKCILGLVNLATAFVSYGCFRGLFGNGTIGIMGSVLYTWCPYRCSVLYRIGDMGESMAWTFVPIVLLGLVWLYDDIGEHKRVWLLMSVAFGLLAFSDVTYFCIAVGAALIWFVLMGKKSLCKCRLWSVAKTIFATLLFAGWRLIPILLDMRNPELVGAMIPANFRMGGLYLAQYFSLFPSLGSSTNFAETGARNAMEMGVGAAALLLVFLYLGFGFVKKWEEPLGKRMLVFVGILLFLGSNLFPWDLMQNKNMLFSIVLALLQSPANWVVFAYVGVIWIALRLLQRLAQGGDAKLYQSVLVLTALIAFGMNQFFVYGL